MPLRQAATWRRAVAWFAAAGVLLTCAACEYALPRPTTSAPAGTPEGNVELVMHLADQPFVRAEAAYRACYVLAAGTPFAGSFTELTEQLRSDGTIARHWQHAPGDPLRRSELGFMICRACKIRTGINWNLTGLGRYAWRELQYHGIAAGGDENKLVSGGEFVGILARAEEYQDQHGGTGQDNVPLGARPH